MNNILQLFLCCLSVERKIHLIALMHFIHAFQVFQEVFDVVFISKMNLELYLQLLQLREDIENNQHKEIECIDVNHHWYKTVNNEWKLKTVMVLNITMKLWSDWIQLMKIMKFQWKQWEYSMYCHHLFPSGADVIQIDGRNSFVDGVEIITEYQLLQIWKEREVLESSSFLINQKLWERWWVIQLLEIVIDWNDLWIVWEYWDWFGQWIILRWWVCDSVMWTGSLWGHDEVNLFVWWLVLCLYGGRGLPVGTTGHPLVFNKWTIENNWK